MFEQMHFSGKKFLIKNNSTVYFKRVCHAITLIEESNIHHLERNHKNRALSSIGKCSNQTEFVAAITFLEKVNLLEKYTVNNNKYYIKTQEAYSSFLEKITEYAHWKTKFSTIQSSLRSYLRADRLPALLTSFREVRTIKHSNLLKLADFTNLTTPNYRINDIRSLVCKLTVLGYFTVDEITQNYKDLSTFFQI
jgi:hypothetical protein